MLAARLATARLATISLRRATTVNDFSAGATIASPGV